MIKKHSIAFFLTIALFLFSSNAIFTMEGNDEEQALLPNLRTTLTELQQAIQEEKKGAELLNRVDKVVKILNSNEYSDALTQKFPLKKIEFSKFAKILYADNAAICNCSALACKEDVTKFLELSGIEQRKVAKNFELFVTEIFIIQAIFCHPSDKKKCLKATAAATAFSLLFAITYIVSKVE